MIKNSSVHSWHLSLLAATMTFHKQKGGEKKKKQETTTQNRQKKIRTLAFSRMVTKARAPVRSSTASSATRRKAASSASKTEKRRKTQGEMENFWCVLSELDGAKKKKMNMNMYVYIQ